jgi:hypothetical protein
MWCLLVPAHYSGKDLNPELPSFPATLGDLMDLLKGWRARLSSELEDKVRTGVDEVDEGVGV